MVSVGGLKEQGGIIEGQQEDNLDLAKDAAKAQHEAGKNKLKNNINEAIKGVTEKVTL